MQHRHSIAKTAFATFFWLWIMMLSALVPAHPRYLNPPQNWQATRVESSLGVSTKGRTIPNNILVLRVEFPDQVFRQVPAYPDHLAHDKAFFERWMLHLSDFYEDASHGRYTLNHHVYPDVFTMPRPMSYYGEDTSERIDARIPELLADLVSMADPLINFSEYGGLIIFHAGPGQESDISSLKPEQIWSTFLTRKDLQRYFDKDNDAYPGYPTADGANLINVVIIPESQFQDYFPGEGQDNAEMYLFSIFGVLAHQFGHIIGLPTLFDNDSSNGRSQGIGNWGLMGTGVWNGNGYVPAQLSAWSRLFLGWEDAVTVSQDSQNLQVDHFLNHDPTATRLYKVPISQKEYFLIENRQQNPDGSLNPYNGQPSYSFKLLPDGEQEYYANYPELPYFNFMTNRYIGSEWDFFLPGLGGPVPSGSSAPIDGSGLLIWHIDENIIEQNFTTNFDRNRINADAAHKGIDLEEADGIQHLDTAVYDIYKYGGPFDAFRDGHNSYFGNQLYNDILSLPAAESYYGGVPLEIYDIGTSANKMSFSVRFQNYLNADYEGPVTLPAAMLDFDGDGNEEIFHPLPDGKLLIWKDDLIMDGFPIMHDPLAQLYMWDGEALWLPTQVGSIARLHRLDMNGISLVENFVGYIWASHPVDSGSLGSGLHVLCPLTDANGSSIVRFVPKSAGTPNSLTLEGTMVANLVQNGGTVMALSHNPVSGFILNTKVVSELVGGRRYSLSIPVDSTVVAIAAADILPNAQPNELIVQTPNSVYLFALEGSAQNFVLQENFPYVHNLSSSAPLSINDVDRNSMLDILIGGENGFVVIDYNGRLLSHPTLSTLSAADSLGIQSGVLAFDIDNDGKTEYFGNFSRNRVAVWEDDFRMKKPFPISLAERSRSLPLIGKAPDNKVYLYSVTDNGRIYRNLLPQARLEDIDKGWFTEYANLRRTAHRLSPQWDNQYGTNSVFVPGEVYIFPNPLKSIYDRKLTLNVMTSRNTEMEIKVFDISGTLVYSQKGFTKAYLRNREVINLPWDKLTSGIYIATILANNEAKTIKFGIEK